MENFITVFLMAVGLSMDAFAISVSNGLAMKVIRARHAFRIAFAFGFAQLVMPVLGWLTGKGLQQYISSFDHWVAFVLLSVVGGKMIYEAAFIKKLESRLDETSRSTVGSAPCPALRSAHVLVVLAVATSIDALAVGITLPTLNVGIWTPSCIIGIVTFALCFTGVYIGKTVGHFFESGIEIIGGIVLVGIGVKILADHLIAP